MLSLIYIVYLDDHHDPPPPTQYHDIDEVEDDMIR